MRYLLCLLPLLAYAQPVITSIETTPQQAIIRYTPGTAAHCTIAVSEAAGLSPLHPDVDSSRYANSNRDDQSTTRTPVGLGINGLRAFIVGTRIYDRSLAADSTYFARVTCDAQDSAVISFRTRRISGIAPRELAFDSAAHGNWAMPMFGGDTNVPVVDPTSGAKIWRMLKWPKLGFERSFAFLYQEASGWTNPANLLSDDTATLAAVSGTSPAFVAFRVTDNNPFPRGGFDVLNDMPILNNMQIRVHGSGTSATAADRQINVCLTLDSGQTCYTDPITVTLPQTTATTQTIPSAFPGFNWEGWSRPVTKEWAAVGHDDGMSVSGSTATVAPGSFSSFGWRSFRREYVPGTKIFIAGSSCPNQVCSIASINSHTQATLNESTTVSNVQWRMYHFGIRVVKVNSSGTVNVSFGYRTSQSKAFQNPVEESVSEYTVTANVDAAGSASAATPMRLVLLRDYYNGPSRLMACAENNPGDCRVLSLFRIPTAIAGHDAGDLPNGGGFSKSGISLDQTTPNAFYTSANTPNGLKLFRLTYTGNYSEIADNLMADSGAINSADNQVSWENLGRTGQPSITAQLAAAPGFDSGYWGTPTTVRFEGQSKGFALFYYEPFGQDREGWLMGVNVNTGLLAWAKNSRTQFGRYSASCIHANGTADLFVISTHARIPHYGACFSAGAFAATPTHVLKSGTWSTNTSLPWPPDSSYEAACPSDIDQYYKDRGATGNRCVQIRFPAEPCKASAPSAERTAYPCASNGTSAGFGRNMEPGDTITNAALGVDSETMMLVKRDGLDMTFLRDQWNGYSCIENDIERNRGCFATGSQGTHANGWTASLHPASIFLYIDPATGEITEESGYLMRGHLENGARPNNLRSFVGSTPASNYGARLNSPAAFNGTRQNFRTVANMTPYAGLGSSDQISNTQSYITVPGSVATGEWGEIGADYRHINGGLGAAAESPGATIGTSYTLTLQGGTTSVYEINPPTGTADKRKPYPWVWAGHYILADKSSATTGNTLTDADTWHFCVARVANECRTGSTAGKMYAVIPGPRTDWTNCVSSQMSSRAVCALYPVAIQGQITQVGMAASDIDGVSQRSVSMALTRPAGQYVYGKARPWPSGQKLLATAHHVGGWWNGPIMIDPGAWAHSSLNGAAFTPVLSKASANHYVEFGYNPSFHCTSRAEACRVTAATIGATPFLYAGEAGSDTASSSTVTIPALPGRVLYYRQVIGGVPGPVNVVAP
jgi:hypothetical protein